MTDQQNSEPEQQPVDPAPDPEERPRLDVHLQLPLPRWPVGSVVYLQGVLGVVEDILIRGRWAWTGTGGPEIEANYYCYRIIAQAGSDPAIRPGMVWDLDGTTVDEQAVQAELQGPVTPADAADTIQQRHADWLAQHSGYPPTYAPPG